MKKQLMSWAPNFAHFDRWDRLAITKAGTFVASWICQNSTDQLYKVYVVDVANKSLRTWEQDFKNLAEAQLFADKQLLEQGFSP